MKLGKDHDWLRGIAKGNITAYNTILVSNKASKITTQRIYKVIIPRYKTMERRSGGKQTGMCVQKCKIQCYIISYQSTNAILFLWLLGGFTSE